MAVGGAGQDRLDARPSPKMRFIRHHLLTVALLVSLLATVAARAQDDVTTRKGTDALGGGWITGPASNPLSFLNGPAYRTFGSRMPYDWPDFKPMSELDGRLPQWLNFQAEERMRVEGYTNGNWKQGNDDAYGLNRFRVEMDLHVNRWVSASVQAQDARPVNEAPPIGPPNENRWDLKEAYVQLGDPARQWASLRVGRQLMNYNNTLVANSEWRDQGRSYDAAVVNLQHGPYRLGIFAASVVIPQALGVSPHEEGNNLYGLYGGVDGLVQNSTLEPFVLWRVRPGVALKDGAGVTGKQDETVYGLRWKARTGTLDYGAEAVMERGSDGPDTIRAWGATGGVGYQMDKTPGRPRMFAQLDYATGDGRGDATHRTFDTVYPTAHDRFGMMDLFGWQNIRSWRAGATVVPRHRWSVTGQYLNFWLEEAEDAAYNSSGEAIGRDATGLSGKHLGEEADVYSWYELNAHMNIGAGYGVFEAGGFVAATTGVHRSAYPYFAVNFKDAGRAGRD